MNKVRIMEINEEELLYKLQHKQELAHFGNLLVVFGEEDYYRQQIVAAVPEYIFQDVEAADREISVFDKDLDVRELRNIINTYPFFCGRSLVIIKDEKLLGSKQESDSKKAQLDKLADILSDIPEYCTVLVSVAKPDKRTKFFKVLKKQGLLCECASIKLNNLAPWLDVQAKKYGAHWEYDAIGRIIEYLQPVDKVPLQLLQQEIAKLDVYAGERKTWTKEDVENIFASLPEASNFALINAVAKKNLSEALNILAGERKNGTNILPVCALIMFKLRQMLQFMELAQKGYDYKGILAELKLNPYVAKNLQQEVRRFNAGELSQALLALAQLNVDLRQGGRDYTRLEEILICLLG